MDQKGSEVILRGLRSSEGFSFREVSEGFEKNSRDSQGFLPAMLLKACKVFFSPDLFSESCFGRATSHN